MSKRHFSLRLICLVLAMLSVVGLCACGDSAPTTDYEATAERFIEAYYLRDYATRFSMMFFDARQQWVDQTIAYQGSEEEFFAEAQRQADERGIEANVDSFESYFAAFHRFSLEDCKNVYGEYTVTTTATESLKLEGEQLDKYRKDQLAAIDAKYIDADAFNAVTEAYQVTVNIHIDGDKKDYNENYLVNVVWHDGAWLVVSHSI